ncbi:MAG: ABC transporter permease [Acidimicrobiales bacterium]|jgi:peptide/nickel transport system permease protein
MVFLIRRLVFYIVAAWFALTVNFFIPRAMPGNAVEVMMSKFPSLQPSAYKALVAALGVGRGGSLLHQYSTYLADVFQGHFGTSLSEYPANVSTLLAQTLPWTVVLVGTATIFSFALGTLLGIVAAWRRGGWLDRVLPALGFFQAVPYFFLAILIVDLLAVHLHWFPASGGYNGVEGTTPGWNWSFIQSALDHSVLPALTIALASTFGWMLQMRNVMLMTVSEDYVLVAEAKGLSRRRVVISYAARNAILPNISGFALALGFVVSGAIVMEVVFSYPGVGLLLYNAVTSDDYPLMQAVFFMISLAVLFANLLADAAYVIADPRVRSQAAS